MDQWKTNGPLWMFLWPCLLWLYGIIRHRSQDIMRQVGQTLESNSIIMCIFAWVASWNIKDSYKKIDPWKKIVHKFVRGSKQNCLKIILGPKNFRFQKFWVQKKFGSENFGYKKIWCQKNFESKNILVPKIFGIQTSFGTKNYGSKKFRLQKCLVQNYFGFINVGSKKFLLLKRSCTLVRKQFWIQKDFGSNKILSPEKI